MASQRYRSRLSSVPSKTASVSGKASTSGSRTAMLARLPLPAMTCNQLLLPPTGWSTASASRNAAEPPAALNRMPMVFWTSCNLTCACGWFRWESLVTAWCHHRPTVSSISGASRFSGCAGAAFPATHLRQLASSESVLWIETAGRFRRRSGIDHIAHRRTSCV